MTRICLVAHTAFGALSGGQRGHIGGVELQIRLMSRWLADRGYEVSVLTWDEGQPDDFEINGVKVIKLSRADAGLPGLRFFHPRWIELVKAMRRADADIYYHNNAEYVTGQVALWCRRNNRAFVYSSASDADCDYRPGKLRKPHVRLLYRYGLRTADRIIVQTGRQRCMLKKNFGLDSEVIPMPCPELPNVGQEHACHQLSPPKTVVWVGRIAQVKRLDLLLDVARLLPDVSFKVAGPCNADEVYIVRVMKAATGLSNVEMLGRLSREQLPDLYASSALLCCTSLYEGFPNTFLEAWSFGRPVISTFDPDGLIEAKHLGLVASDAPGLAKAISRLLDSEQERRAIGVRAKAYVAEHHSVDIVMQRFQSVFESVLTSSKG